MHDKVEKALQVIAEAVDSYAELAASFAIMRDRVRELEKEISRSTTSELADKIVELERQRHWLAERLHRKGTVSYGKYPPTTEGWIKAAEQAIKDFGI